MKHLSTSITNRFSSYARRGALLLALGAAGPAAWGQSFGTVRIYPTGGTSYTVQLHDLDGDGRLDIVTSHVAAPSLMRVLLGQASGSFGAASSYPFGPGEVNKLVVGDVNGDGRADVVAGNYNRDGVSVMLGQAGGFAAPVVYTTNSPQGYSSYPYGVALGDVNGDGRPDIAQTNSSSVGVLLGQASGGFAPVVIYPTATAAFTPGSARNIELADLNGDGRLDAIYQADMGATTPGAIGVMLGQPNGAFAAPSYYPSGCRNSRYMALGDLNGDGRLDVAATDVDLNVRVLLGQAGGAFGTASLYPTVAFSSQTHGVAIGDVNGDGRPDLVNTHASNQITVLLGQASGGFVAGNTFTTGSQSDLLDVKLGDVNGDGRLDIVAEDYAGGNVRVLLNTGTYTPLAARATAAPDVALAPNPAHDAFTVALPAGTAVTSAALLNALGQVVRRPAVAGPRFTVPTAGLAPGVYTLRLQAGAALVTRRVVID